MVLFVQDLIKDAQEKSKSPAVVSSAVYGINWAHQVALMSSPTDHVSIGIKCFKTNFRKTNKCERTFGDRMVYLILL